MKTTTVRMATAGILFLGMFAVARQPGEVRAAGVTIVKLGTLAPNGGSLYNALLEMGQKWSAATDKNLQLKIYADGTQGGEADMVRLMRANILTSGMLTVVGLSDIEKSVGGLSFLPLAYQSWAEFDYVLARIGPRLEKMLLDKGFVVLFWGDAGWVHYFSKTPALHPDDLKSMRLFTWAGDSYTVDLMKSLGYTPVPLEPADILPSLRTGMINALPLPAFQALAGQIYTVATNMLSLNWGVLSGATVIRKDVWDKFEPDLQKKLLEAASAAGAKIRVASRKEDTDAIKAMQAKGLKVNIATPQIEEEWHKLTAILYPQIRGKMVPADIFDEIQRLVAEYRNSKGAGK
jgi:TRAP-type C4-dicarboxylate transport system substrate-binding protein